MTEGTPAAPVGPGAGSAAPGALHSGTARGDAESDPSVPGAGARRVVAITQLYFRLTNSPAVAITIADALCLTFAASGATLEELASYLGLAVAAVRAGIEAIPVDMRCTSADLEDEDNSPVPRDDRDAVEDGGDESAEEERKREVRHYLNYKRILPYAYAHLSHILLALCVSPLPRSTYTEGIRRAQMRAVLRGRLAEPEVHPSHGTPGEGELPAALSISPTLRKREALEGVYCLGCQFYFALQDFTSSVSRCPTCRQDVLRTQLGALKAMLDARYVEEGRSLVSLPAAPAGVDGGGGGGPSPSTAQPARAPSTVVTAAAPWLDCALARDPFLLQQALAFLFLYSTPFAALSDARCIVDPDAILTEPEYARRLRGGATLADEFRARHRQWSRVRVRLVSQRRLDAAMREENARKMAKRARLPPWLALSTTLASLARGGGRGSETAATLSPTGSFPTQDPAWVDSTDPPVGRADSVGAPADPIAALRAQAAFVASEFFEDDYEPVLLPRHRWCAS